MTTNFFDSHIDNFKASAAFLGRVCNEFAEQDGNLEELSLEIFRRAFTSCDSAVKSMVFECIVDSCLPCCACVYTNGKVDVIARDQWEDWCKANNM